MSIHVRANRILAMATAVTVMGAALVGCGKAESIEGGKEPTVTVTVNETPEVEDYTYCSLLSDPYFDMGNAIKDEQGTEFARAVISSAKDKDILYNIIDGNTYVEISGADVYEVNKTITVYNANLSTNLAYYGVDPNPGASGGPCYRFNLIETSYLGGDCACEIHDETEIKVLRAYTVPADENGEKNGIVHFKMMSVSGLCEVEYNGEHYWTGDIDLRNVLPQ